MFYPLRCCNVLLQPLVCLRYVGEFALSGCLYYSYIHQATSYRLVHLCQIPPNVKPTGRESLFCPNYSNTTYICYIYISTNESGEGSCETHGRPLFLRHRQHLHECQQTLNTTLCNPETLKYHFCVIRPLGSLSPQPWS